MAPPAGMGMATRSQSGVKKSLVGVKLWVGVVALACRTVMLKSIWKTLLLPQPPTCFSAAMTELDSLSTGLLLMSWYHTAVDGNSVVPPEPPPPPDPAPP